METNETKEEGNGFFARISRGFKVLWSKLQETQMVQDQLPEEKKEGEKSKGNSFIESIKGMGEHNDAFDTDFSKLNEESKL